MKFYFDNYLQEKLKELKKKIKAIRRKVEKAIKNIKEEFELAAFRLQRRVRISVAKLKDAVKNHIEEIPPLIDDAFTVKNPSKAARMAEIYGEELSSALYDTQLRIEGMQNAIIRAAVPIAQAVVPIVNTAVRALTVLANTVGKIISAFLEGSLGIKAYENSLKSAVRTTGSMERYLAGFDQIERLGSGGGEGLTSALIPDTDQVIPGWEKLVEKIKSLVKPLGSINFTPAIEETKRALSALQPVLDTVMEAIGWAFSNILVPVAQWAAENILPAFLEVLTTAFQTLGQIIEQLKPTLTWLWENWLQKLAQWYGDKIIRDIQAVGEKIQNTGDFIRNNLPTFDTIIRKIGEILDLGVSLQTDAGLWENMLKTLIPSITTMSQGLGTLPGPLGAILTVLGNFLPTLGNVTGGFQGMKENAQAAIDAIKGMLGGLWGHTEKEVVTPSLKGTKTYLNKIIEFFEGSITGISDAYNKMFAGVGGNLTNLETVAPSIGSAARSLKLPNLPAPAIPGWQRARCFLPTSPLWQWWVTKETAPMWKPLWRLSRMPWIWPLATGWRE